MSRFKNIMQTIDSSSKLINTRYGASFNDVNTIVNNSNGDIDKVYNGFIFGYLQGLKAARAEMKGGVTV